LSIHAYLAIFYYIGFGHIGTDKAKGPDNKTDIVEPICPFINGYIGFNYISRRTRFQISYKNDIEEPKSPLTNRLIGFGYIGTNIVEPICPIID
jgi:hypothetical protein